SLLFHFLAFFFLLLRLPPISTLFPYTTLFRSCIANCSSVRMRTVSAFNRSSSRTLAISAASLAFILSISLLCFSSFSAICLSSRSEEHTSELQSRENLVCRLLLEKKKI